MAVGPPIRTTGAKLFHHVTFTIVRDMGQQVTFNFQILVRVLFRTTSVGFALLANDKISRCTIEFELDPVIDAGPLQRARCL